MALQSPDPKKAPLIDPNFLSDPRDGETLLKGIRMLRRVLDAPALAAFRDREVHLTGEEDDAALMAHIRARADTIYHPIGTCKMGADAMAVVDPELKVRGMENLRVVDASVMPTLIGGNTNAPTIMIAEKAAGMIGG